MNYPLADGSGPYDVRMVALPPSDQPLLGGVVRLDPFEEADADALAELLLDPALHEGGFIMYEPPSTHDEAVDWVWTRWVIRGHHDPHQRCSYAVRLNDDSDLGLAGTLVGVTSLGLFEPANESVHVGWTVYGRPWWGTRVNAEAKLLLLREAFETLHYGRVQLQTDAVNQRSQAAIERLGAVREGVLRRHMVRADGTFRDTVVYSILADEWPTVRAGLEARLAAG